MTDATGCDRVVSFQLFKLCCHCSCLLQKCVLTQVFTESAHTFVRYLVLIGKLPMYPTKNTKTIMYDTVLVIVLVRILGI